MPAEREVPSRPGLDPAGPLVLLDDDGSELLFDADEAASFMTLTDGLVRAAVSACPGCAARVLACVAVVDLLDDAPPHPRSHDVRELADDAPTLHLYVVDLAAVCRHHAWRDPGYVEWREAVADVVEDTRGPW